MDTIRSRYLKILERIVNSAQTVGRDPVSIRLVVVTKRQPIEAVQEVVEAGALYLGENYADEALEKKLAFRSKLGDSEIGLNLPSTSTDKSPDLHTIQWHIIGHVQSRKAHIVAEHFDYLHSLDSVKLAQRLDRYCNQFHRILPVLLEMNVSGEETKSGWPAWDESRWTDLLEDIEIISKLSFLRIEGLMMMAPFSDDPEQARPYFQRLRRLQEFLKHWVPHVGWHELSMGMSDDFEVAVQEGATWVRIGQAILGPRQI